MEVSGVRKSCVTESSSADLSCSPSRAASAFPKSSTALALSTAIAIIELNEAFAAQSLSVIQQAGLDASRVNPNGGAIALGHPLGCTGAKLTASIIRELQRRNARYGMVTMCIGGGMGAAGIFERL